MNGHRILQAVAAALLSFAAIGTVAALLTPAQGFEIWLLLAQSALIGLYVAVRRP